MIKMYHVDITDGLITFISQNVSRTVSYWDWEAPNAKQYFDKRGEKKPKITKVTGFPFKTMYVTIGNEKDGTAVAWAEV